MKKKFTFLLAVAASVGTMFASDIQVDGIWYDFDQSSKTATVTYRGSSSDSYSKEYTGDIVIPASVTYNYNGITYSVTSIGNAAFAGCTGLTSVTIPNSVTSIEDDNVFWGCFKLTSVTINSNAIVSDSYGKSFGIGSIFGSQVTEYVIGDSVTAIGTYAFSGYSSVYGDCKNLASVTIGKNVTSIGNSAFRGCSGLTSIEIPGSVTSIGNFAFNNCNLLNSITIPNNVLSIGQRVFQTCPNLKFVTIPSGVVIIDSYTFGYDSAYNFVALPNSVTTFGNGAFTNCYHIDSIVIPSGVINIGTNVFNNCSTP